MPKIQLPENLIVDVFLGVAIYLSFLDCSWQAAAIALVAGSLKAFVLYLPKKVDVSADKIQELEDKISLLKKDIVSTRIKIGLER